MWYLITLVAIILIALSFFIAVTVSYEFVESVKKEAEEKTPLNSPIKEHKQPKRKKS